MSDPIQIPTERLTLAEFYAWADQQPEGRYELQDGRVVAMAPERAAHVQAKTQAWLALRNAIRAAGLPCVAYGNGLAVEAADGRSYQPDALVNCGERLPGSALVAPNPVIVVEVGSPSTSRVDSTSKFADYMRPPVLRHYVILDAVKRIVIHHRRQDDGTILSRILGAGPLALDPPGLTIQVEALFED
jgi:Uma2 family endonuclease